MNVQVRSQGLTASHQLAKNGFEILDGILTVQECQTFAGELSELHQRQQGSAGNKLGGLRNLIRLSPSVAELATSTRLTSLLQDRLHRDFFPVRALFFDKTPAANWSVAWHQDVSIAVAERIETAGFGGWSVKEEIIHVQPSRSILENMVTVRLHLDNCDASNGALKVIPGSHADGKLEATDIARRTQGQEAFVCEVAQGGALLMHPLLLHSSSQAKSPSHRRVLHIEYAADELPNGLKWFDR